MDKNRLRTLFERLDQDDVSQEEITELNDWYHQLNIGDEALKLWFKELGGEEKLAEQLYASFRQDYIKIKSKTHYKRIFQIAAAVVVLMGIALSIYLFQNKTQHLTNKRISGKISPAQKNAKLTLADGSTLNVNELALGTTNVGGAVLEKTSDGRLIYKIAPAVSSQNKYNTISTPRAGQFEVVLADGTHVWLNAASSLQFPLQFKGQERLVTLTGEGYFEVAHDRKRPFKVKSGIQTLTVLGTHFNVKAYQDDQQIATTLFSGSVNVTNNKTAEQQLLKPGKQAAITRGKTGISVINADLDQALSWKNGYFIFDNEDVKTIMTLVSRWYDVDVEYHITTEEHYGGTFSRSSDLQELLKNLESLGKTKFQLKERKIIVSN